MQRKRAMVSRTARSGPAETMPEKLAASAFTLFSERGIGNVTVDDVAARAGVTKGSLYWHYKSKDELIKAACAHYYRAYHRRINAALAHITDPAERLARTIRTAVNICLVDRGNRVFTTEVFTLAIHDDELRRSWRQFAEDVREFYLSLVQAADQCHPNQAEQTVDLLLSAMEGLKLRAQYEPHLCAPENERTILVGLKRLLALPP